MEKCLLWMDCAHSPYFNMAVDELLLEHIQEYGKVLLRFYEWDVPAASYGYSQKPSAVTRGGLTLVRRPTGGGVVYHDVDLTYTMVIPAGHPICELNRMDSYKVIHEPVMKACLDLGKGAHLAPDLGIKHDRATLQCFVSPSPNDVLAADETKLAGAAQRRTRKGILHQGSVSLKAGTHEEILQAIKQELVCAFGYEYEPFTPSEELLRQTGELVRTKYATEAWNLNGEGPAHE